jgi:hypothetical protein
MVMNFFCTKRHLDEWYAAAGFNPDYYGMALAEALAVSRLLFGQ